MNFYPEGKIVQIIVPLTDADEVAVVPTSITAVLMNGEEELLLDYGTVSAHANGVEAHIIVPSAENMLQGGDLQEIRLLKVTITYPGGSVVKSHSYAIEAEQSLQIMRNSFMTYETAMMMSTNFVNMTAFSSSTDERRKAALVEAYNRITRLSMTYTVNDTDGVVISTHEINRSLWNEIDDDAFKTQFPSHFKKALRSAQLAETDSLLQGNVIAQKHAQGIVSETIGESSVTLRPGFSGASDGGLSSAALVHLSAYLDRTMKIGRA